MSNVDFAILQRGVVGKGDGADTYVLSNNLVQDNAKITLSDTGVNTLHLIDGLEIASSKVAANALLLTLSNGAKITVLDAASYEFVVGGDPITGETGTSYDLQGLASNVLGVEVPTSGIASGGNTTLGQAASSSSDAVIESTMDTLVVQRGITGKGSGHDTYVLSNNWIEAGAEITITDTGNNTIQFIDGLEVASSMVAPNALMLTLSNGATVTVLDADDYTFEVGGNPLENSQSNNYTFTELITNTLNTDMPSVGGVSISNDFNFQIKKPISFTSTQVSFDVSGFTSFEINQVLMGGSDSKIFLPDREIGNLIITPHQDSLQPDANGINRYFPLVEYNLSDIDISIHRIIDDFQFVGSKPIDDLIINDTPAILFGGTGPEYTDGRDWPFGNLWVAKLHPNNEIEYRQVTTVNAFYHGISAGDINQDGLDDIVAVHMGSKNLDGMSKGNVDFFIQGYDGSFTRALLYSENPSLLGGSSILVSDLDNDGLNEILVASYGNGFQYADIEPNGDFSLRQAPYSFHVMQYEPESEKVLSVATMPLEGSMVESNGNGGFGVIDIAEIDFDLDGDNDLMMLLETGSLEFSFEFYRNEGGLEFSLITDQVFENSYFDGVDSFFRHIDVVDLQGDGLPDFVLSGRNWWDQDGPVDLGQFVYINTGYQSFQSLGGNEDLMIDPLDFELNNEDEVVRTINYLDSSTAELRFLLTQGGITALDFIDVRMDISDFI